MSRGDEAASNMPDAYQDKDHYNRDVIQMLLVDPYEKKEEGCIIQ